MIVSIGMGVMSFFLYKRFIGVTHSVIKWTWIRVPVAVLIYSIGCILTKTVTLHDIQYIPLVNKYIKKFKDRNVKDNIWKISFFHYQRI